VDEKELAAALGKDLNGSFEKLVRTYQDRLYSFALRLSRNAHDAEEIAQDAFVRAYEALKTYPKDRVEAMILKPWLYRITLNVFRNRTRRKHVKFLSLDSTEEDSHFEAEDHENTRPGSRLKDTEMRNQLEALIASLPEKLRAAVLLRYVEGLDYTKLAAVLGQPVGTAKSNVHRGIQMLKKALSGQRVEVKEWKNP
jgi:RNA polymerase sigma-70 factor, ECF subfamily